MQNYGGIDYIKARGIAIELLKDGAMSNEKIARIVGLSAKEINELKEELIRDEVLPAEALVN